MSDHTPSSAEMRGLLDELKDAAFQIRSAYVEGNTPRVIGDGVYMAGKFGDVLDYIRSLEADHKMMREAWETVKSEHTKDPKAIPILLNEFAEGVLSSLQVK